MRIVLISGLSGSGKSIALNVLEDAGFFCVDNLPATLLLPLVAELCNEGRAHVAVAMDMRTGPGIAGLPQQLGELRQRGIKTRFIFLDARDDVLIQRFSETRRRHPLADSTTTLAEAIAREREALATLAALGHHIDTSHLHPNALRSFVREFIALDPVSPVQASQLTLLFESFGFKHGLPLDADLVFDVRCLPNPYYDAALRPLTGLDAPVIDFLESQYEVRSMREDIRRFVATWLPAYIRDNRNYLTVAIGCTGGQHRSVHIADWLGREFRDRARVLIRHRALAGAG